MYFIRNCIIYTYMYKCTCVRACLLLHSMIINMYISISKLFIIIFFYSFGRTHRTLYTSHCVCILRHVIKTNPYIKCIKIHCLRVAIYFKTKFPEIINCNWYEINNFCKVNIFIYFYLYWKKNKIHKIYVYFEIFIQFPDIY